MTSTRERAGWAVLFGLPMGAGIGVATARTAGMGLADPLVVAAGGVAGVGVAAFVFGVSLTGSRPPE